MHETDFLCQGLSPIGSLKTFPVQLAMTGDWCPWLGGGCIRAGNPIVSKTPLLLAYSLTIQQICAANRLSFAIRSLRSSVMYFFRETEKIETADKVKFAANQLVRKEFADCLASIGSTKAGLGSWAVKIPRMLNSISTVETLLLDLLSPTYADRCARIVSDFTSGAEEVSGRSANRIAMLAANSDEATRLSCVARAHNFLQMLGTLNITEVSVECEKLERFGRRWRKRWISSAICGGC
jgi:hypothetical protein